MLAIGSFIDSFDAFRRLSPLPMAPARRALAVPARVAMQAGAVLPNNLNVTGIESGIWAQVASTATVLSLLAASASVVLFVVDATSDHLDRPSWSCRHRGDGPPGRLDAATGVAAGPQFPWSRWLETTTGRRRNLGVRRSEMSPHTADPASVLDGGSGATIAIFLPGTDAPEAVIQRTHTEVVA
jgi:hypothetical protein